MAEQKQQRIVKIIVCKAGGWPQEASPDAMDVTSQIDVMTWATAHAKNWAQPCEVYAIYEGGPPRKVGEVRQVNGYTYFEVPYEG